MELNHLFFVHSRVSCFCWEVCGQCSLSRLLVVLYPARCIDTYTDGLGGTPSITQSSPQIPLHVGKVSQKLMVSCRSF